MVKVLRTLPLLTCFKQAPPLDLMADSPDIQTAGIVPPAEAAPEAYSWRHWRPHPVLPALADEEILRLAETAEGRARVAASYNRRERLIALSETPGCLLDYAFELECWKDADIDLRDAKTEGRDYGGLYIGGGKRSSKSTYGARTILQSALAYPGGILWVFQRTLAISRITVQRILWEWLPKWIRGRNDVSGKRKDGDPTKIRYTPDGGFAGDNLVLPNSTLLMFLSYDMEPRNYQGAEIGAKVTQPALHRNGTPIPNIGAWLDEDAPLAWVQTVRDRLTTRNSKFIWTFTTENGITLAVKTTVGAAANVQTLPVDDTLPSDRVLVRGCPAGHVPYRQRTSTPGISAIYFHTRFNKFGTNYTNMAAQYRGRDSKQILANLFGYSEDMTQRVWPLFGGWNFIDEDQLPAEGTNYLYGDPGGSKNFTWMWLRIAPGMGEDNWYIYDEWPDAQTFGEWALPDDSADPNPNGIRGPAQRTLGWGTMQYKQMILGKERIVIPENAQEWLATETQRRRDGEREAGRMENSGTTQTSIPPIGFPVSAPLRLCGLSDPMKIRLIREAIANGAEPGTTIQVPTRRRYLDPRAAGTEAIDKAGGRTLIDKFHDIDKGKNGEVQAPGMHFEPAPGLDIRVGIEAVNRLLYFDKEQELVPGLNYPRLFIVRRCRQIAWAMDNFSIRRSKDDSEASYEGACKDFADLPRYAATTRLRHVAAGMVETRGGGSY